MVKDATLDLRYKIKSVSEVLRTESPAKIAKAILSGRNPPKIKQGSLESKVRRLLDKRDGGTRVFEDKPRTGRPRSILTPKDWVGSRG